ncbi:hypothetical protein ACE10Z_24305 [Bradyrhizobium sp. Pha-3]|uniref:hypothetical protein n=1 Tax=Bradyrhizobium sp. Pha-3 TaxID=208375 RepID=UPI0035D48FE8
MALTDGDPAPEGDIWYRILTSKDHITKGRIQHAAFQGKFLNPPPADKNRPWDAETSGRLRSLAGSIDDVGANCIEYCKRINRTFYGLMFPKEKLAGQTIENLVLGVHFTPIDGGDQAHSDLTFTGNVPAEKTAERDRFILELSKKFNAIHPDQINLLPEANLENEPEKTALERGKAALLALFHKIRPT